MAVRVQALLWILLLAATTTGIAHNFPWAMMAFTAFLLAYLTKGSRGLNKKQK
jgi:hypothetical protein